MAKKSLTKTNGKSKNEVEKFPVTGFEKEIPELRKIDGEIQALMEARNEIKARIIEKVVKSRRHWEKKGKFYKSFVIYSGDGVNATVLFKNIFSKVDPEQELEMRKLLTNSVFDELYDITEVTALKPKPKWDELKLILGKRASDFLQTSKHISHKKDFMERRADLRDKVSADINKTLDEYTESVQASPDLRLK